MQSVLLTWAFQQQVSFCHLPGPASLSGLRATKILLKSKEKLLRISKGTQLEDLCTCLAVLGVRVLPSSALAGEPELVQKPVRVLETRTLEQPPSRPGGSFADTTHRKANVSLLLQLCLRKSLRQICTMCKCAVSFLKIDVLP